ncbi:PRC-barrel domain-containing protein [Paenarthrobacter sp. DKR-5]|uniref:PRC-barrel domain-containing protein n=1 Tax=Paenarthrobacter sp. DKR-5 TaxID=2835535 RepID=UPI001BDC1738|nr:PRC-barrel domain-containing protein [Paenarthrobacter sp. DKR-5]MBT1004249.1 PRC-barrel domain-containing protein [Paenarthrobacter sp. DKR-5]
MIAKEHLNDLLMHPGNVIGSDGEKIGGIAQIYLDDGTDQPSWVTVSTGLFGSHETFIPLAGARTEGSDIIVQYSKDQIKDAPRVDPGGHLEPEEEDKLFRHYQPDGGQLTYSDTVRSETGEVPAGSPEAGRPRLRPYDRTGTEGSAEGFEEPREPLG